MIRSGAKICYKPTVFFLRKIMKINLPGTNYREKLVRRSFPDRAFCRRFRAFFLAAFHRRLARRCCFWLLGRAKSHKSEDKDRKQQCKRDNNSFFHISRFDLFDESNFENVTIKLKSFRNRPDRILIIYLFFEIKCRNPV